ncbi:MAG: carboxypeptidase regulatory-like domain-containing protein [Pirellulaceae bacterium]|nr:carboxypeptidase regulatory-like domain-containing protein [Pirellulaceae bacterium]
MRNIIKIVLCISLVFVGPAQPSWAATPSGDQAAHARPVDLAAPVTVDVALSGNEGVLSGQVVDSAGKPVAQVPVALRMGNRVVAEGKSDADGRFGFRNLRGGVYQVLVPDGFGTFRAWADGTAPESADSTARVVSGRETIRGQHGSRAEDGPVRRLLGNPLVLAGIVGVAVAVPIAVHNSKDDGSGKATVVPGGTTDIPEIPASD